MINTGNANAGTGADGLARARRTCEAAADLLGIAPAQVLPFSTGVIMETLPVERIEAGLPAALVSDRHLTWYGPSLAEAPHLLADQLRPALTSARRRP